MALSLSEKREKGQKPDGLAVIEISLFGGFLNIPEWRPGEDTCCQTSAAASNDWFGPLFESVTLAGRGPTASNPAEREEV
jgi:hypothetical protein